MQDKITDWKVQLGSGSDKLSLAPRERFFLSRKLNGNRCSFVNGSLISRQGRKFTGIQHILEDITKLGLSDSFLDGELILKNDGEISDGENFRMGNGIINSSACSKENLQFVVFDAFPLKEFATGSSKETYATRKKTLCKLQQSISEAGIANLAVVDMVYEGSDPKAIDHWLEYAVANDWEGIMLNKNATYRCSRTTNLIKIKRFHSVDLEIIDVIEGTGNLKGTLGAIAVKYKNNTVHLGNGFDALQREKLWKNRSAIIGRIAEVKYKEESSNKRTGLKSLQFPTFVCIREIGKQVSYYS